LELLNPVEISILKAETIIVGYLGHERLEVSVVGLLIELEIAAVLEVTPVLDRTSAA